MHISLIGTGLMGRAMAERLIEQGHSVTVFNRTRAKAEALRALGAHVADTPAQAIQASPISILMLADYRAIVEVLFESHPRPSLQGKTIVQMGTIRPGESQTLCESVHKAGGQYFEAPVLGSKAEARSGTLLVMVGATEVQYAYGRSILAGIGSTIIHVGPVGKAAALKLALNQLIASHIVAFSLSVGLVQRTGIDVDLFMSVLRQSALIAPMFDKKLPRLLARDYTNPNFPTKHLLKDVRLCRDEAEALQLDPSVLKSIEGVLEQAMARSFAEADYSSVFEIITPAAG